MKARLVKLGAIDNKRRVAMWELTSEQPLIVLSKPDKTVLTIQGDRKLSNYVHEDKIPKHYDIHRYPSPNSGGAFILSPDTPVVRIYYDFRKIPNILSVFWSSLSEVFQSEYGITVRRGTHRPATDDIVLVKDGKEYKCGAILQTQTMFLFGLTLRFNSDEIKGMYKFDNIKFKRRGDITDISQVVRGLSDEYPNVGEESIEKVVTLLCDKMGWELEQSTLTSKEEEFIQSKL